MRRNIGGETNRDATGWIDNGRNTSWQIVRLDDFRILLVSWMQRNSITFHIGHEGFSQRRKAHLCIAIGSWGITILTTHVALPFDERVTQGERLGHTYGGIIDGGITMGMIVSQDEANHLCTLDCWTARQVTGLAHTRQDSPLYRF